MEGESPQVLECVNALSIVKLQSLILVLSCNPITADVAVAGEADLWRRT